MLVVFEWQKSSEHHLAFSIALLYSRERERVEALVCNSLDYPPGRLKKRKEKYAFISPKQTVNYAYARNYILRRSRNVSLLGLDYEDAIFLII